MNPQEKTQPDGEPSPLVILHYEERNKRLTWITPFTVADEMRCTLTIICDEIGLLVPINIVKSQECDVVTALKDAVRGNRFIVLRPGLSARATVTYRSENGSWNSGVPVKFTVPEIPVEPISTEKPVEKKAVWCKRSAKLKVKLWPWLMIWLTALKKAEPDRKPSALPFQEGSTFEQAPTWWSSNGKSFLYMVTAYRLWPCGQSIEIQKTNPDLKKVTEESKQIMKKSDETEIMPTCADDGTTITIINITPHTKSFILCLTTKDADGWKRIVTPAVVKFGGGSKKTEIKDWPALFNPSLLSTDPKKGSSYQLQVSEQNKKGEPNLIGFFDYTSAQLAKAFGVEEIESTKQEAAPNTASDEALEPMPQTEIENFSSLLEKMEWDVENHHEVTTVKDLKRKLGYFDDMIKDAADLERNVATALVFHSDNDQQLKKIIERCKVLVTKIEEILKDTGAKLEATLQAKTQKPANTPINVEEIVSNALKAQSIEFEKQLGAIGEQLRTATAQKAEQTQLTFSQRIGAYYRKSWLSWRFIRWALIILVTGVCLYWDSTSGTKMIPKAKNWFFKKPAVTADKPADELEKDADQSLPGDIPKELVGDPNKIAGDVSQRKMPVNIPKNTVNDSDKGISITIGDIGKNGCGSSNTIVSSVVVIGNGDYYAHGTNAITEPKSSMQQRIRMPDLEFPMRPRYSGEVLTCIIPPGAYAQIDRAPIGWQIQPKYHFSSGKKPEECFIRYGNGQKIDIMANVTDMDEGCVNLMNIDLKVEFICTYVGK